MAAPGLLARPTPRRLTGDPMRDLALWVILRALLDAAGETAPVDTSSPHALSRLGAALIADAEAFLAGGLSLAFWADAAAVEVGLVVEAARSGRVAALTESIAA